MDKSLERTLKQACEQKFKISLLEMKDCCVTNNDYMLVKFDDKNKWLWFIFEKQIAMQGGKISINNKLFQI